MKQKGLLTLQDLGYNFEIENYIKENHHDEFTLGRVTREDKERYIVSTGADELEAEITGNLRYTANSRADFPAVGDWVTLSVFDTDMAIIHHVLPRKSVLERQAIGKFGEKQIIAANIDTALVVQSIDNNFNINRLERYLTICYSACIEPVLVINKIDLSTGEKIKNAIHELETRDKKVKYFLLSNTTREGFGQITGFLQKGKTYCVAGSSGVGKSTLVNNLLQKDILKTGEISISTNKGRHTTNRRELFVLENGGIIIDTPGMRELGITDDAEGLKSTFTEISDLSTKCKFRNCTHTNEPGCAILDAIERGDIDEDAFENYKKIQREQQRFQISVVEKHKKDKEFGKMCKEVMKEKRKTKF